MKDLIKSQLERELREELEGMAFQEAEAEGYQAQTERFDKLYRLYQEDRKLEYERKHGLIRTAVELVGVFAPLVAYGIWFRNGLKFEQTGSISSGFMRNLLGNIRPKR